MSPASTTGPTDIAGRTVENEDLVNVPNWLPLSFRVADGPGSTSSKRVSSTTAWS